MKTIMEKVINKLTDKKAEADLIYSGSKNLKLSSFNGQLSEYKVSSSGILGVRAIKDGRVGIAFTEALDDSSLDFMIKEAIQNAETSEPNEHEKILPLSGSCLDIANYQSEPISIEEKTKLAIEMEMKVREADKRVVSVPYNSYSEGEFEQFYLSSRGRWTEYKDRSFTITSSALMEENGKKSNYYDFQSRHHFRELTPEHVRETALFHAKNLLRESSIPTGRYPVFFTADCLKEILDCFANLFSAKATIDKMNPWAQKIGSTVASQNLTISDQPLFEKSFRISRFDSEGVERKPLSLIENGELKSFYHNSVTASKMKTMTTGHASRGPSGSITVGGTDLVITGKNPVSMPGRYLEVIQLDGLYSGANRVTGNFSAGVKGYLWEGGERKVVFGNITLSGNIMELMKNVDVAGTTLQSSTDQSFFTVPLVFHDLSIAGS